MSGRWRSVAGGFVASVALTAGAALGEPETVQVEGEGLSGIWELASPDWVNVDLAGTVHFGPLLRRYCRMERMPGGFMAHCIGWDYRSVHGEGELDGNKVHISGGFMLLRFMYDGELTSPTSFDGRFGVRVLGIRVDDPDKVIARKLQLEPEAPDGAGHGRALREVFSEIANEQPGQPPIAAASKRNAENKESLSQALMQTLGPVQAVIYLGDAPRPHAVDGKPAPGDDIAIYDVEFGHGSRLCAVDKKLGVASGIVCA